MRIIAGRWGGRRLPPVRHSGVRPTTDRVREALMSALSARGLLQDAAVLDLFCGTGALGLEALSRGAAASRFVDKQRSLLKALKQFASSLDPSARVTTQSVDLLSNPAKAAASLAREAGSEAPYSLVFADPPYAHVAKVPNLISAIHTAGLLTKHATVVVEHPTKDPIGEIPGLQTTATYHYGDTGVILFENTGETTL